MNLDQLREDLVFDETIRGTTFTFHTTWGLFSPKVVDPGTRLLIDYLEVEPTDTCLDLGCGYGPIGIAMSKLASEGTVYLCDKDFVAVRYARMNARINHRKNCEVVLSNGFDDLPSDVRFDVIASNLPAKVNKELLLIWMHEALARLNEDGRLYVVTISGIREFIKRSFKEIFGNYEKTKQSKAHTVSMAYRDSALLERLYRWQA